MQLGTTILVSVGASPFAGATPCASSEAPEITADGRQVAFYRTATNLIPGVTNGGEIYIRDVVAGTTLWASTYAHTALQLPWYSNTVSFSHSISADGQFVSYEAFPFFQRFASSPVPPTTSPGTGVILRYNVGSGLTDMVSTNAALPVGGMADAHNPVMTPDGRFVAFVANANGATPASTCILVWDAETGTSVLASGDLTGAVPTNSICVWPALTPDGRYVAFVSNGTNFVTNSLTLDYHVYLRDLQAATTTLLDADTNGFGCGVSAVMRPRLSDDGGLIALEAPDNGLVPNDSNRALDVFVRDTAAGVTELVSSRVPTLAWDTPNGPDTLSVWSVSQEGSLVAFSSEASDLVSGDTNGYGDVFVRDRVAGSTLLVSVDMSGVAPGNGMSYDSAITADGRYVAFTSTATNLVAGDTNNASDVFVRDLLAGSTLLVSVNTIGFSGNRASYSPQISADGRYVLFHSLATDLAPFTLNYGTGLDNIFWRNLWSGVTYGMTNNLIYPYPLVAGMMTPSGRFVVFGTQGASWYVWDSQVPGIVYSNATVTGVGISSIWTSPDGNRIVYASGASQAMYLVDRLANSTVALGAACAVGGVSFSADSRFVAYATTSANVAGDTNGLSDVYLYDYLGGTNVLVSQAYNAPASADGNSDMPVISPDRPVRGLPERRQQPGAQ